jgi:hypothetical protein
MCGAKWERWLYGAAIQGEMEPPAGSLQQSGGYCGGRARVLFASEATRECSHSKCPLPGTSDK